MTIHPEHILLCRLHTCAIFSMVVIKNKILVTGGDDCIKVIQKNRLVAFDEFKGCVQVWDLASLLLPNGAPHLIKSIDLPQENLVRQTQLFSICGSYVDTLQKPLLEFPMIPPPPSLFGSGAAPASRPRRPTGSPQAATGTRCTRRAETVGPTPSTRRRGSARACSRFAHSGSHRQLAGRRS